jgi:hypothetical protein
MSRTHILSSLVLALGIAACGGSSSESAEPTPAPAEPAVTPAEPPPDDGPVVGPPQVAWKDMDKKQRGRYMVKVVVPAMEPLFKGFDAKRFAEFNCATCHGKGAADQSFKMPNPDILALPGPDRPDDFKPIFEKHPDMVKFMGGKVMPEMAKLLGREPFDYKNPKPDAFGCLNCHTKMP